MAVTSLSEVVLLFMFSVYCMGEIQHKPELSEALNITTTHADISLNTQVPVKTSVKQQPDVSTSTQTVTFPSLPPPFTIPTIFVTASPPDMETHLPLIEQGADVLEQSDYVLTYPATQAFLTNFSNPLQLDVIKQQLQYCPYRDLCSYSWHQTIETYSGTLCCKACSCSSECEENMSCCPDIIPEGKYNLNYKALHKHCIAASVYADKDSYGKWAYDSCPQNADNNLKEKCERDYKTGLLEIKDIVPVTDENIHTYRNIYCAMCSSLSPQNLTYWTTKIVCDKNASRPTLSSENVIVTVGKTPGCDIVFLPKIWELSEEHCDLTISTCNVTGLWLKYDSFYEWACSFYTAPLRSAKIKRFKNVFCMLCNGHTEVSSVCPGGDSQTEAADFSFSALLNVEEFESHNVDTHTSKDCQPNAVLYESQCIYAQCAAFRSLSGNSCLRLLGDIEEASYLVHFRMLPVERISTETAINIVYYAMNQIGEVVQSFGVFGHYPVTQCMLYTDMKYSENLTTSDLRNSSLKFYDIRVLFESKFGHDPESVLSTMLSLEGRDRQVYAGYDGDGPHEKTFVFYLKDDKGRMYDVFNDNNIAIINPDIDFQNDSVVLEDIKPFSSVNTEDTNMILPFMFGIPANLPDSSESDVINLLSQRPCPLVTISRNESPWTEAMLGLKFRSGMFLNYSSFTYASGNSESISVCLETYGEIQRAMLSLVEDGKAPLTAEAIVSLSCVSLSILCLFVTLLTFVSLPAFATLPWKNNFMLTLSLLLAQLLYLVGSYGRFIRYSIPCISVGISIHFFLLMFIVWMHICTVHMFRVITRTKLISKKAEWCKFFIYIAYSILLSSIFVAGNIIYSVRVNSSLGYGENICYISSQKRVLFTFGIPLALVVVSNICMFGLVMRKIKQTSNVQKNVQNDKNLIIIIAKLSVITGLTWIFGLVYMVTNTAILSYIFIILNGSQGVFLMVSFLCNGKVLTMYKSRLTRFSSFTKYTK